MNCRDIDRKIIRRRGRNKKETKGRGGEKKHYKGVKREWKEGNGKETKKNRVKNLDGQILI